MLPSIDPAGPRLFYNFAAEAARLVDLIPTIGRQHACGVLADELRQAYFQGRVAVLEEQKGSRNA